MAGFAADALASVSHTQKKKRINPLCTRGRVRILIETVSRVSKLLASEVPLRAYTNGY